VRGGRESDLRIYPASARVSRVLVKSSGTRGTRAPASQDRINLAGGVIKADDNFRFNAISCRITPKERADLSYEIWVLLSKISEF
jgi:hypothetical protein